MAVYEADPYAHISKLIRDIYKEIVHFWALARFYEAEYVLAYVCKRMEGTIVAV